MYKRIVTIVLLVAVMLACFAFPGSAAGQRVTVSDAVEIRYGRTYSKNWTSRADHAEHYVKFAVPARGVVAIHATKPLDSAGEYGNMYFTVYDSDHTAIWDNYTRYARDDQRAAYDLQLGLAAGTYYLAMKPGFPIYSGRIETSYSLSYEKKANCEAEPNGSAEQATPLIPGKAYCGWFGSDGGREEESDYFAFDVVAGETYRITWLNAKVLTDTTVLMDYIDPSGEDVSIRFYFDGHRDINGSGYYEAVAKQTGTAYLRVYNYARNQLPYRFILGSPDCVKLGHKYRAEVTYPTLTTNGHTVYACDRCQDSYLENYTFSDVRDTEWYYKPVEYAVAKGYFSGRKNGTFGPHDGITRQDFMLVLARLANADLTQYSGKTRFEDVLPDAYYAAAVQWATESKLIAGYSRTKFGVDDKITREQMVNILYRYVTQTGYKISVTSNAVEKFDAFADANQVSPDSRSACIWALDKGLLSGKDATTFDPLSPATRAQVASVLMNLSTKKILSN